MISVKNWLSHLQGDSHFWINMLLVMKHRPSVSTILKRNVKVRSDNPFGLRITVKYSFTRLATTDVLEKFNVVNCLKPLTMPTSLSQTVLFTRVKKDLKGKVFDKLSLI